MAVRRRGTAQRLIALLALAAATATGCSGKSAAGSATTAVSSTAPSSTAGGTDPATDSATDSSTDSTSAPSTTYATTGQKPSDMTMRVVNVFAPKGDSGPAAPGPALDVYDVQLTGQPATPVAANVAYGAVSPYFTPTEPANSIGHPAVQLYALPAGEDPMTKSADSKGMGGAIDDGSHAQITIVLTADNSGLTLGGALGRLSFSDRVEHGDDGNGSKAPVAPAPPSGQGEILVDTGAVIDQSDSLYLLIGHSCAPPINGDPNAKGLPLIFNAADARISSRFAIFTTTGGSHEVSVVSRTESVAPTCAQLAAKQGTVSVDITAGQQIEAYLYGTSATDLHLALAPIRG